VKIRIRSFNELTAEDSNGSHDYLSMPAIKAAGFDD